ncbi:MAG: M20/M25/M40 family metallo-hydrolase [Syntrophomonadaceae bacterium]|nr:M20/M25/M40 family metallo-hydrolase [Syntrophomonadaceae bacterium]MDH7498204.1 M20/M25/M40 family metallo-hydrolase [Syntrophomonadaceae bacterium]
MVNQDRLLAEFLRLVAIDSVSGCEGRVSEVLRETLGALGFQVTEDEAGKALGGEAGNLIARLPGNAPGPSLVFCAHMDTVEPGSGVRPELRGGCVYSAGDTILGGDDKAGIVAILEGVRVVIEQGWRRPDLEVVFTVSEEQGLMGSKHLDFARLRSRLGFVLDSVGEPGAIITRAPRQNEIEFEVLGRAAHAGIAPETGVNAIQAAARALAAMPMGRIDAQTTCNIGVIEGGKARNIVPDRCHMKGEARSLSPARLEEVTRQMVETFHAEVERYGAQGEARVSLLYPEMDLAPGELVVRLAARGAEAAGLSARIESTGGGSDASIFNGAGIRCVNLGIGMQAVHTTEEHIALADLAGSARWVACIIREAVGEW